MSAPHGPCVRCGRQLVSQSAAVVPPGAVRHHGRGLCGTCRTYAARHGDLADYERTTRSIEDTLADYRILRGRGLDHDEVSAELGLKPASLQRQLERARARTRQTTHTRTTCEEYVL